MNTTVSREGPTRVRLEIEVPADEVKPAIDRAFKRLASQTRIPGFRPGKAPRAVLEARLGPDEIKDMVIREAVPQFYAQAVVGENVEPVTNPQIEVTDYDESTGLKFEAIVEVRPEIELPSFEGLRVERPPSEATEDEVDAQLGRLAERFATLETVARPAQSGDFGLVDIKAYWNNEEIANASAHDMLYEIGSERIVPELDRELAGKRSGDILKFNATLPSQFGSEWGGKEVSFQVLVKETRQKNVPAIDDEFAKTASEFETLGELRDDLREKISQIKKAAAAAEVRSRALDRLVDQVPVIAPDAMVEEELAFRLRRFSESLNQAGVSLDDYLASAQRTEAEVESDLRRQAERNVAAQLILDEIARAEHVEASDAEVEEEVKRLAEGASVTPADLRKQLDSSGRLGVIAGDIMRRKALETVVDKADIVDEVATP